VYAALVEPVQLTSRRIERCTSTSKHPRLSLWRLCTLQARIVVDAALVETVLGPPKYSSAAEELSDAVSSPGVVAGLVWTAAGGGVQCVECVAVTRGEGRSEGAMGE
jgi:ATP-dependent Lon protease